ncbi:SLAM family member 5 isoform X2 [Sus scrofa]|uniref:SLAM family member 5 isoform X2 n=1 Tax=Sus scrofa TaxID=9823 RepID=UPI0006B18B96|nr:SLAM family member 5 isoform X2 [Sus scrofa]
MAHHHTWILLLCLQTRLGAVGSNTDITMVNGILGESVTFSLSILKSEEVKSISWNSKTSVAVVVPGNSGTTITVTHQNYYDRLNVSGLNYNLELRNLRMEDSGIYKADITVKSLEKVTTITKCYDLQVYRRLGKPKITRSLMTSMNGTCNVTLTCSVEKEEKNVTYSWSHLGREGNVLQIFQTPDNQHLTYTCTAWNPVSNNSDSISAQQLCADIAVGLQTRHPGLLSGLAVLSVFIIIIPSVILCLMYKRGQGSYLKTFSKNPDADSKKTIYTYITAAKDAQTAEYRIYDEIPQSKVPPTKEEPVNTIYSIVQYSDKRLHSVSIMDEIFGHWRLIQPEASLEVRSWD